MRRFGEPRILNQKYVCRPGAYAVISDGYDLLLTLQEADELELQLPGGGIDAGETPTRALHREVFEETGHRVTNLRRIGVYQRYTYMAEYSIWAHKICHIYHCDLALRVSEPPEKCHTNIWMSPKEAVDNLTNSGDSHHVQKLFEQGLI